MNDLQLIKSHALIHAYICHLIELGCNDSLEPLIDAGLELEHEIEKRKISNKKIKELLKNTNLSSEDRLMIGSYIYEDLIQQINS